MSGVERTITVPETLDAGGVAALWRATRVASDGDVLVLRAAHRTTFCRGLSPTVLTMPPTALREGLAMFADLLLTLATGPAPTVAVLDGLAVGGGVALAAACDVVIATPTSRLGLPETAAGLPPHLVLAVLSRRTTVAARQRLALDGRSIDALEGQRLGLVDAIADGATLERGVAATVRQLGRVSPEATAAIKSMPEHVTTLRRLLDAAVDRTADRLQAPAVAQALAEQLRAS